ncbi:uncharacterized protein [Aegilops tauschii subsp. strangulata]|uniref:uncharacterized protein n=1 Tax=Aegilops tauschii subsp. strangulata TaxID=200361 RepID=UPI003CC89C10
MSTSSSVYFTDNSEPDDQLQLIIATQTLSTLQYRQFLSALTKFDLTDHIDSSPAQATSFWVLNDFMILSWYNAVVTPSTLVIVADRKDTTYSLWHSLRSTFRSNCATRITYLLNEFHSFTEGDLSIEYTPWLKNMADTLRDLGHRLKDRDLIHNMLRGLNKRL